MKNLKSKIRSIILVSAALGLLMVSACSKDVAFVQPETSNFKTDSEFANRVGSYSDKQIFEGLFFGTGEVARLIPSIDHEYVDYIMAFLTEEEIQTLEEFKEKIFANLVNNKPEEFARFIQVMKSGDNELISEQIISFSNVYYDELKASEDYGEYFVKAEERLRMINREDVLDENGAFDEDKLEEILTADDENDSGVMTNEEAITTLGAAPVICLTLIVWNYGVIVNAAAAVNVAIGVNVVVLCFFGVGDDCFSRISSDADRDRLLQREMLINEISVNLYE
ncbi:hypothetical protein M0G43_13480 [Subsaxibacter sp. CAU 1640]|uniref:hypothetical protein n=1 Tax=Subsaxibacter sp. CAU 1640 TaxID=2933271 RepID=UPI0020032692|nr:hypothetical protein [Subsaxibacter sp. CAU 1640]MCK7591593.1 hypothetical protein [Subsaxibacter sp. CAU 1640]